MPDFNLPDSALIPTTEIYQIEELEANESIKTFLTNLTHNVNNIALIMNMKDTGYYVTNEIANSQSYFNASGNTLVTGTEPRPVYRKVVWWNQPLPNTGSVAIPHGIQGIGAPTTFRFTRIYGCATDPNAPIFFPIPFASPVLLGNSISLFADAANVTITTGIDRSNFTSAFIVLEYVKES